MFTEQVTGAKSETEQLNQHLLIVGNIDFKFIIQQTSRNKKCSFSVKYSSLNSFSYVKFTHGPSQFCTDKLNSISSGV